MGTIYILTSPSGKSYIGQTTQKFNYRITSHLSDTKNGSMLPIHMAIRKYGIDNFKINTFEFPNDVLNDKEIALINDLETLVPNGYNVSKGGTNNLSEEAHNNRVLATTGRPPWNKGKPWSIEMRKKISKSKIGSIAYNRRPIEVTRPGGEKIIFASATDAAKKLNLNLQGLCATARGKCKHHKGFTARYLEVA